MRVSALGGLFLALATAGGAAVAQEADLDRYVELLRSDLRTEKVGILTEALDLAPEQADLFWPIQREYEAELAALGDRKLALIEQLASVYGTMTDEQAASLSDDWFDLQNDRVKLFKKYHKRMEKALGSLVAAQFIQVESLINMLVDVNLAAEIPLLE